MFVLHERQHENISHSWSWDTYLDCQRLKADQAVILDKPTDRAVQRREFFAGSFGLE